MAVAHPVTTPTPVDVKLGRAGEGVGKKEGGFGKVGKGGDGEAVLEGMEVWVAVNVAFGSKLMVGIDPREFVGVEEGVGKAVRLPPRTVPEMDGEEERVEEGVPVGMLEAVPYPPTPPPPAVADPLKDLGLLIEGVAVRLGELDFMPLPLPLKDPHARVPVEDTQGEGVKREEGEKTDEAVNLGVAVVEEDKGGLGVMVPQPVIVGTQKVSVGMWEGEGKGQ